MENTQLVTLSIITPTASQQHNVEWLEITSPNGSFFIGPNHSPLVSLLKPASNIIYKLENHEPISVATTGGIVTIKNNTVLALLD